MNKERAEEMLNNLYEDCCTYEVWDTTDDENWMAMRDAIEKLAEYFDMNINNKREI